MLLAKWTPQILNTEAAPISLGETECSDALNFLFERGVARTRPHLRKRFSEWASGARVDYAKAFLLNQGNRYIVYIDSAGALRRLGSTASASTYSGAEITGAGTSFGDRMFHNVAVWAGIVLVGNNVGGLLTHTPISTSTYAVVSDAKYRYVTTSFNRAVAAYDITSGANNPRKIGWSTTTDITDWTSTGAGSTELTDIPDDITGIVNINNIIVVARTYGWTLGYVTGSNTTGPFRWEMKVREGSGCAWPSTLAHFNNTIFCVGHDDVYTFDIASGPSPIGGSIRDALMHSLHEGARYKGIVTRGDYRYNSESASDVDEAASFIPRLRYHLVPIVPHEGARHYSYDVREKTWAAHSYNTNIHAAFEKVQWPQKHPIFSLSFVDDSIPPQWYQWFDGQSGAYNAVSSWPDDLIDQDASLTSPVFLLNGSAERDYDVKELYLVWAMEGGPTSNGTLSHPMVDLTATFQQNHKQVTTKQRLDLACKIDARRSEWNRTKFPMRLNGNLLKLKLNVPTGIKLAIKQVEVHGDDSAQSRAA